MWLLPLHAQGHRCSLKILQLPALARTASRTAPHCSPETSPGQRYKATSPSSSCPFKLKIEVGLSSSSFQDMLRVQSFSPLEGGALAPRFTHTLMAGLLASRLRSPGHTVQACSQEGVGTQSGGQSRMTYVTMDPAGWPACPPDSARAGKLLSQLSNLAPLFLRQSRRADLPSSPASQQCSRCLMPCVGCPLPSAWSTVSAVG